VNLPLIARAVEHDDRIAIATPEGRFSYAALLQRSGEIATDLLNGIGDHDRPDGRPADLQEQRVAFLIPAGFDYVATQWGIWRAGGIAVPLCVVHPRPELEYVITNAAATIVVAHPQFEALLRPIAQAHHLRFILTSDELPAALEPLPAIALTRAALILYTSGTTGKPKGVVLTHQNIQAQVTSLVTAWEWSAADRILHVLPLHHIHGIINVLTCALWVGAECHLLSKFDAEGVWQHFCAGKSTLFMAVPTIYTKLIAAWEQAPGDRQAQMSAACRAMRLMVSGSAALPVPVLEKWQQITGQLLLERYGMTEIGMALSNPLRGQRRAGYVGNVLPQVEVRLVDDQERAVATGTAGEIQVKGPGVFQAYWNNPEATAKAFQAGWFQTGDWAVVEQDCYRILGRISVDIIKTGGYKVSALEIEAVLRSHPAIQDCAVVGVDDPEWGERVCAALVLHPGHGLTLASCRSWAKEYLAVYKVPTRILTVMDLPRNAMGKVTKPAIAQLFDESAA
jgi:malonyl-CoA/methylmalonyl-CoA synthetase